MFDPISFLINLVIGVVLSVVGNLWSQANRVEQQKKTGTRGTSQVGGKVPRSFLIGTVGDPGKLAYPRTSWGNSGEVPNAYLTTVLSFGSLPVTAMTALFISSSAVTLSTATAAAQGYAVPEYHIEGKHHLWRSFQRGDQTSASPFLVSTFGAHPDHPWTPDMVGRGVPYLTATMLWGEGVWASATPPIVGQFQGIALYDIRKDSTRGGVGPHRWAGEVPTPAEQATWEFSDNNMVIIYNLLRGVFYNGERVWGGRSAAAQLPYAPWAAAMDACDQLIALKDGGTERAFRGGRKIYVNEEPRSVINEFLVGCNGRVSYASDGTVYPLVGVPAEVDGAFTDDDLLGSEPLGSIPLPRLDDIINGATATYREPSQAWEDKETAPYYRIDLEAEDDGRRQTEGLSLDTTFSGTQAQRVLKATVEEARRFGRHVVALPASFAQYRPLQVLSWTSDRFGYSSKRFLITVRTRPIWGWVVFGLQEIDPTDHNWNPATDEQPLSFAPVTTNRPAPQEVSGPSVAPVPGTLAYDVFWSAPSVAVDVQFVRVSHQRPDGSLPYSVLVPKPDLLTGSARIPVPFDLSGKLIEVQIEYLPYSGRPTVASAWMPVTIADVKLSADMVDLSNVAKDVLAQIGTNRTVIETFKRVGTLLEEADRENYTKRESLFREVQVELEGLQASFTEIIEVALDPQGSGAMAQVVQQLRAALGGNSSEINVRWQTAAAPEGYSARFVLQAAVNDGTFRAATLFLDVPANPAQPTRIGLMAGQTAFFTSGGVPLALISEDGIFRSANNTVQINMLTGAFKLTSA